MSRRRVNVKMTCRLTVFLIIFLSAAFVGGRDIYVATNGAGSSPFGAWENASANIQWAVNVGTDGDTVWISNGTYYLTNQITVKSNITISGFTNNGLVIIDGNNSNRCFNLGTGTLANLFIRNGYTNSFGGGVRMNQGIVRDCVFSNNITYGNGGGLYSAYGTGLIQHCAFVDNKASNGAGLYFSVMSTALVEHCLFQTNIAYVSGGGMYIYTGSNLTVTGCDFICNVATNSGGGFATSGSSIGLITRCTFASNIAGLTDGGGLMLASSPGLILSSSYVSNNFAPTNGGGIYITAGQVENCVIARNSTMETTVSSRGGGGILMSSGALVRNCIIEGNTSGGTGGGVCASQGSIRNCLIRNNIVIGRGRGGGIGTVSTEDLYVSGCTIVSNYALTQGGGIDDSGSGHRNWENNIIYFNTSVSGSNCQFNLTSSYSNCCFAPALTGTPTNYSTNNTTANPQFIDWVGGNYRLNRSSPCVNTGVNRDWMTGAVDLDGQRRIDRFSDIVDMGCYEYVTEGTIFIFR